MRHLAAACLALAALSGSARAFDLGSVLNSVNQAVDTAKNVGNSVSGGNPATGDGSLTPRLKLNRPSPVGSPLLAKLDEYNHHYKELDEYTVFLSRPNQNSDGSIRVAKAELLRGQVYKDLYNHPDSQSTMQVWEAYKSQLSQDGYKLDFICDKPCANHVNLWQTALSSSFIVYDKSDRYLVAHKDNTWVSVAIGEIGSHPLSSVNVVVRGN
ncbi:hypothetical protein KIF53_05120 [Chromobacterium subtsugae]|uniref:Uncharacterized protein n=1 Tax=Chromobacterium subtsugae TaxID=251747 RepID=A0ABS7FA99_9NEIS|nr:MULTISPECIES: hypothetical protein [Chromobacterium]KUM04534.1 hypothetical protein Cv017_14020 [Chromobacterium subtsugae]KZE87103.1 hypothetical protein AWB61_12190 [Chromobacterium sp. F49]MBW7565953.1 hypothetical protein [Chromobacterium subtsugae]MBW8287007.1 hypothetical protein [Chromobacterium subtsugae]OBU88225.1 hypothetical protein MY55_01485 [Chromobacterium subtsugae]